MSVKWNPLCVAAASNTIFTTDSREHDITTHTFRSIDGQQLNVAMHRISSCQISLPQQHGFSLISKHSKNDLDVVVPLHQRLFVSLYFVHRLFWELDAALTMNDGDDQDMSSRQLSFRTR